MLGFFYSFLLNSFAVKLVLLIMLAREQMNKERVCKITENIWKSPHQMLDTIFTKQYRFAERYDEYNN